MPNSDPSKAVGLIYPQRLEEAVVCDLIALSKLNIPIVSGYYDYQLLI